ncbi:MAG: hypothetical protein IJ575_03000 [Selenomonadaceae bacterium]|nr:hypothetical protein [Selenomonadaceae bacterium]
MIQIENLDKLIEATLYLFKAVPEVETEQTSLDFSLFDTTLDGYLISKDAIEKCPQILASNNLATIKKFYGYDIRELNRGFYKSFGTVKDSEHDKLLIDQLTHYFTTYGLESLGLRDESIVYIPPDKLNLPKDSKPIKVTIIKSISLDEIESRTRNLISSGVAMSNDSIQYLCDVIRLLDLKIDFSSIRNKEIRIRIYDLLGRVPDSPEEFLRFIIYKKTGSTLIIKNRETFKAIRDSEESVAPYFVRYKDLTKLASIFYRFKPIWIAFKSESKVMSRVINRIRRLAVKYHRPVKPKILDTVTSNPDINLDELRKELEEVTIFKRISIANAILFRMAWTESIVYFIRNGKAFATELNCEIFKRNDILDVVIESIVKDLRKNVAGKSIHLPDDLNYAAPTSEKRFMGNIPFGSIYQFKNKNIVAGVHWENVGENRIDLDLHLTSTERHVGWNDWLNDDNFFDMKKSDVIFSGDMTDAPKSQGGATEAFFIGEKIGFETFMLTLNYFNFDSSISPVPFKLIIDDVKSDRINKRYLIDSHTISFTLSNEISSPEMFLGFIDAYHGDKYFMFTSANFGKRIVARYDKSTRHLIEATRESFHSTLKLKDLLERAGARFEKSEGEEWDIDLDPQIATKDSILSLFY